MRTTDYKNKQVVHKYLKKTLGSVYIGYPALLKLVGNIQGKTVLDLGCGSGWLSRELCKKGAKVLAIDSSPGWIDVCKAQHIESNYLQFMLADGNNLSVIKNRKFNLIIANMVFLSISSRRKVANLFSELGKVIKRDGVFIFSDCHPLAKLSGRTDVKISGALRGFSYFNEGLKHKTTYLLVDYSRIKFTDAHWSLGFYSRLLKKNGMGIEEILEPKPFKIDPRQRLKDYRIPEYIIFKCKKN